MLPRPATMVTGVVVAFAIGGVLKLSTRNMSAEPRNQTLAARLDGDASDDSNHYDDSDHSMESDQYEDEIDSLGSALDGDEPLSEPGEEDEQAISTPQSETSTIEALLQAADAIEALAEVGRREFADAPESDGDADIEKWNEFARDWDDDVTEVATRMPPPPSWNADAEISDSYQDLASAIQELRGATIGNGSAGCASDRDRSRRCRGSAACRRCPRGRTPA